MDPIRLKIAKLAADSDSAKIENALNAVAGVSAARIDTATNQAIVEHDGADEHDLVAAVKGQGFIATVE